MYFKESFRRLYDPIEKAKVIGDFEAIREDFRSAVKRFKNKPGSVQKIILGEAPISHGDYFYNSKNNKDSPFIRRSDFYEQDNIQGKEEMIVNMTEAGIIIVDIYPLPLPSAIYRGKPFYDKGELYDYWEEVLEDLKDIVDKGTKLFRRYKRTPSTKDLEDFKQVFIKQYPMENSDIKSLGSKHMGINKIEFRKLLNTPK